jgi:hypothetical protein
VGASEHREEYEHDDLKTGQTDMLTRWLMGKNECPQGLLDFG